MAFIFTPLSSLALSDIPRERMAQASGLFNVLRQIGGSFGVAIMGTFLTMRTTYHMTMYGQSVDLSSPVTRNILFGLGNYSQQAAGGGSSLSMLHAQALVSSHLGLQAFVSAVDDDFFIAALITFLCVIPIVFLRKKQKVNTSKTHVALE